MHLLLTLNNGSKDDCASHAILDHWITRVHWPPPAPPWSSGPFNKPYASLFPGAAADPFHVPSPHGCCLASDLLSHVQGVTKDTANGLLEEGVGALSLAGQEATGKVPVNRPHREQATGPAGAHLTASAINFYFHLITSMPR